MKKRLDILLDELGLADSRTRAQALIMAGKVRVNGVPVTKSGQAVAEDAEITVEGKDHPWVSRGGLKLVRGLEHFGINPAGMTCIDVGSSTGGFTDVLLTHGAKKVYAVDVGHGQLDWKLRNDPRVVVMEQTNARHLTAEMIHDAIDMVVCDASFIGLRTVLPAAMRLAEKKSSLPHSPLEGESNRVCDSVGGNPSHQLTANDQQLSTPPTETARAVPTPPQGGSILLALIKPQFEVGRERVGKGGVVRDPELHREVCETISAWLTEDMQWNVAGITESPIKGPAGNIEFLICATRN